eukprot:670896-Rhodomonas_salina.8
MLRVCLIGADARRVGRFLSPEMDLINGYKMAVQMGQQAMVNSVVLSVMQCDCRGADAADATSPDHVCSSAHGLEAADARRRRGRVHQHVGELDSG